MGNRISYCNNLITCSFRFKSPPIIPSVFKPLDIFVRKKVVLYSEKGVLFLMKKTIGVSAILLSFSVLAIYILIYHSEIYLTFLDRQKLTDFVHSFGKMGPVIFISLQVFQVLFAPIPGEVTGFLGGFLYGNFFGILYSTIPLFSPVGLVSLW
jgi:hypothetical protein